MKIAVATFGEKGSLSYDAAGYHEGPIYLARKVVNTVGAGDSYIAGFLGGLADGRPVEECMHLGAATATDTLQYFGAW